ICDVSAHTNPDGSMHSFERRFRPDVESAAAARRFVSAAVQGTGIDGTDAALLTSELVNNAIVHTRRDFAVRVDVGNGDGVVIGVVDHLPRELPMTRAPALDGGRGLALLDAIAPAWGVDSTDDEKCVWFRLPRA